MKTSAFLLRDIIQLIIPDVTLLLQNFFVLMCHCYVEVWRKSRDLISLTVVLGFSYPITSPSAVVVSSPSIKINFVSCRVCRLASDKVKPKFLVLWAPNLEQKGRDPSAPLRLSVDFTPKEQKHHRCGT